MPLSMMPAQHKMSARRGLPAHGIRGSSQADPRVSRAASPSAASFAASSPDASSTKTRYNQFRAFPSPACAMMGSVTDDPRAADDPFAAARASADRLTALAGPHDAAVVLGSGWAPAADAIGAAEAEI